MSARNIQFQKKKKKKKKKNPYIFVFLSYRKNSAGTKKRVRIIQSKRAIGVRVIEVNRICKDLYSGLGSLIQMTHNVRKGPLCHVY